MVPVIEETTTTVPVRDLLPLASPCAAVTVDLASRAVGPGGLESETGPGGDPDGPDEDFSDPLPPDTWECLFRGDDPLFVAVSADPTYIAGVQARLQMDDCTTTDLSSDFVAELDTVVAYNCLQSAPWHSTGVNVFFEDRLYQCHREAIDRADQTAVTEACSLIYEEHVGV